MFLFLPREMARGTSKRYFPFAEKFNPGETILIFFVIFFFSSSQIASKGSQNKECIERVCSFLNTNSNGGEFFLNIKPENLLQIDLQNFTLRVLL